MRLARDTWLLTVRSLREASRQPGLELGNLFIPLFFFYVTIGSLDRVAGSFGVADFVGFQMPVAILQGVTANTAGAGLVTDLQRGYFDKLVLTSTPRPALVLGRIAADAARALILASIILVAAVISGAEIQTGPVGALILIGLGVFFAVAFSCIGVALALRTASTQAVQLSFLLFFPLIFLSPAFTPREVFQGWLDVLATLNPFTYILEGSRTLILEGWDGVALAKGFGATAGLGIVTVGLSVLAYRWRDLH
jgi:ABC-2 type transport system permease protein